MPDPFALPDAPERPPEYGHDALVVCDNLVRIYQTEAVEVQALQGLDLLVHAGEMPAARVGRSFRVPREAVQEYLRTSYSDAGDPELDSSR